MCGYMGQIKHICVGTLGTGSRYSTHTQHIITGARCDLDSTDQDTCVCLFQGHSSTC